MIKLRTYHSQVTNKILFIELVCMGSVKVATVEPMNVFRVAVMKNAVKVILVHNHPSGELTPSKDDKNLTDRLIQVGKILGVEVIEHLIITLKSFLSFADIRLLEKLAESTEYVPTYVLVKRIKKEEKKIREAAVKVAIEKGIKKGIEEGIEIGKVKGKKEGIEEGEERGKKKGEKNKAIEMAKTSIKEGLSTELISRLTGLSKAQITKSN